MPESSTPGCGLQQASYVQALPASSTPVSSSSDSGAKVQAVPASSTPVSLSSDSGGGCGQDAQMERERDG
jgi:hypothetical protein